MICFSTSTRTPSVSSNIGFDLKMYLFSKAPRVLQAHNRLAGRAEQSYKTVMCQNWLEQADCHFGSKCRFAHGPDDLRTSTWVLFLRWIIKIWPISGCHFQSTTSTRHGTVTNTPKMAFVPTVSVACSSIRTWTASSRWLHRPPAASNFASKCPSKPLRTKCTERQLSRCRIVLCLPLHFPCPCPNVTTNDRWRVAICFLMWVNGELIGVMCPIVALSILKILKICLKEFLRLISLYSFYSGFEAFVFNY